MSATAHHDHSQHKADYVMHGAWKWWHYFTFNTDHKVIGVQYLVTAVIMFGYAGLLAMLIRWELLTPQLDLQIMGIKITQGSGFNQLFTMHGSAMLFLWLIPVLAAFGNYIIPLQVGADDMAFPRFNGASYWTYVFGSATALMSYVVGDQKLAPIIGGVLLGVGALGLLLALIAKLKGFFMLSLTLIFAGALAFWSFDYSLYIGIGFLGLGALLFIGNFFTHKKVDIIYIIGIVFMVAGVLAIFGVGGAGVAGAPEAGWTSYPPLSLKVADGQTMWAVAVFILGLSSQFGAINFIVTMLRMRAPGLSLGRLPLFCWAIMAAGLLQLSGTPVLGGALITLFLERVTGVVFYSPIDGGNPLLWQHLFWFYSHPAVYIMVLPAMGAISEIFAAFSRKPVFGYSAIAGSSMGISLFGMIVWGHHMFTSGMNPWLQVSFMLGSMAIGVPTGIKIFNWLATIWGGKISFKTPMLFALGFISLFLLGGITGITLAAVPFDIHVHDTYYVVAHFHYVMFGGAVMGTYAAFYFWFPKITGRMYNEFWGKVHFWMTFIGFQLSFLPMHYSGLMGMPRRVGVYLDLPNLVFANQLSSMGAFLLGISGIVWVFAFTYAWVAGKRSVGNPWRAYSLEWQTSSPPPINNFPEVPVVTHGPYEYGHGVPVPVVEEMPAFRALPSAAD
jgi:cytochrome c oxidase subunit 1